MITLTERAAEKIKEHLRRAEHARRARACGSASRAAGAAGSATRWTWPTSRPRTTRCSRATASAGRLRPQELPVPRRHGDRLRGRPAQGRVRLQQPQRQGQLRLRVELLGVSGCSHRSRSMTAGYRDSEPDCSTDMTDDQTDRAVQVHALRPADVHAGGVRLLPRAQPAAGADATTSAAGPAAAVRPGRRASCSASSWPSAATPTRTSTATRPRGAGLSLRIVVGRQRRLPHADGPGRAGGVPAGAAGRQELGRRTSPCRRASSATMMMMQEELADAKAAGDTAESSALRDGAADPARRPDEADRRAVRTTTRRPSPARPCATTCWTKSASSSTRSVREETARN